MNRRYLYALLNVLALVAVLATMAAPHKWS